MDNSVPSDSTTNQKDTPLSSHIMRASPEHPIKNKNTIVGCVQQFCANTSAHGLAHIVRSNRTVIKCLWLGVFLAALSGISWQLTMILITFFSYPTQMILSSSQDPFPFPDITVCNIEPLDAYEAFAIGKSPHSTTYDYSNNKVPIIRELRQRYPHILPLSKGRTESTKGFFENMDISDVKKSGHSLQNMVVGCSFAGQNCMTDLKVHFTYIPDGTYFNCYIFSPKNISIYNIGIGANGGLSLILYSGQTNGSTLRGNFDTFSKVKQGAGFRVTIHNAGTLPSPMIEGFDIMSGHSTAVGLAATRVDILPHPYGNCSETQWLKSLPKFVYSTTACLVLHAQLYVYQNCSCLSVDLPVPSQLWDEPYCGKYNFDNDSYIKHITCDLEARHYFFEYVSQEVVCHPPCKGYEFTTMISESVWPNPRYHDSFFEEVIASRPDRNTLKAYTALADLKSGDTFSNTSVILGNFARLNVYFKTSEVLLRKQVASYPGSNLLSDMGGTIGLWAGLSLITVLEIFSLGFNLLLTFIGPSKIEKKK